MAMAKQQQNEAQNFFYGETQFSQTMPVRREVQGASPEGIELEVGAEFVSALKGQRSSSVDEISPAAGLTHN